jgi:hypothetical protein
MDCKGAFDPIVSKETYRLVELIFAGKRLRLILVDAVILIFHFDLCFVRFLHATLDCEFGREGEASHIPTTTALTVPVGVATSQRNY